MVSSQIPTVMGYHLSNQHFEKVLEKVLLDSFLSVLRSLLETGDLGLFLRLTIGSSSLGSRINVDVQGIQHSVKVVLKQKSKLLNTVTI